MVTMLIHVRDHTAVVLEKYNPRLNLERSGGFSNKNPGCQLRRINATQAKFLLSSLVPGLRRCRKSRILEMSCRGGVALPPPEAGGGTSRYKVSVSCCFGGWFAEDSLIR